MSISAIANNPSISSFQNLQAATQARKQDFASLASSIQSGDLSGAQSAYTDLQSLTGSSSGTTATPTGAAAQKAFAALGQALTQGNVSQAQSDFSQWQNSAKTAHPGHHHHRVAAAYQDPTAAAATSAIQSAEGSAMTGSAADSTNTSLASSLMNLIA